MDIKQLHGQKFYIDDAARKLSKRYDLRLYRGYMNTLGDALIEPWFGRFVELSQLCREVVGVDYAAYAARYTIDNPRLKLAGKAYWDRMPTILTVKEKMPLVRKTIYNDTPVYFPTETLMVRMLKGMNIVEVTPGLEHLQGALSGRSEKFQEQKPTTH
jgi:hypothetical protein